MNRDPLLSRREATGALIMAVGAAVLPEGRVLANEERLSPSDPRAMAVGYTEDARKVDPHQYPAYSGGQTCENCLQLQGAAGVPYRPCTLFPGKSVAASGWCSAWSAEL